MATSKIEKEFVLSELSESVCDFSNFVTNPTGIKLPKLSKLVKLLKQSITVIQSGKKVKKLSEVIFTDFLNVLVRCIGFEFADVLKNRTNAVMIYFFKVSTLLVQKTENIDQSTCRKLISLCTDILSDNQPLALNFYCVVLARVLVRKHWSYLRLNRLLERSWAVLQKMENHTQNECKTSLTLLVSELISKTKPCFNNSKWSAFADVFVTDVINRRGRRQHPPTAVVFGPKSSGKSTFSWFLKSYILERFGNSSTSTSSTVEVLVMDIDVGQSMFGLPGTVNLGLFKAKDKNDESSEFLKIENVISSYAFGSVSPAKNVGGFIEMIKCLYADVLRFCENRGWKH